MGSSWISTTVWSRVSSASLSITDYKPPPLPFWPVHTTACSLLENCRSAYPTHDLPNSHPNTCPPVTHPPMTCSPVTHPLPIAKRNHLLFLLMLWSENKKNWHGNGTCKSYYLVFYLVTLGGWDSLGSVTSAQIRRQIHGVSYSSLYTIIHAQP